MMWLKRKIRDWVEDANYSDEDCVCNRRSEIGQKIVDVESNDTPEDVDSYTLRVWKARGGRCIQYKKYDRYNDKLHTELYVVSDEEDLGSAVTNIVIQQSLQGN
jgi:hypothetical protein